MTGSPHGGWPDLQGAAYSSNSNNVDYSLQFIDIDSSGIDSLYSGSETFPNSISTLEKTANYLLINDGTGKLYSALHREFEAWSTSVVAYTKTLSVEWLNSISPQFIPVLQENGKLNFLVKVSVIDVKTHMISSVFVNVEANYDVKSDFIENINILDRNQSTLMRSWAGNDFIHDTNANVAPAHIDGGLGYDTSAYSGLRDSYNVIRASEKIINVSNVKSNTSPNVNDTLTNIERIAFSNGSLVFDVTSSNAPAAYRLYGGAFDRTPDEGGFRFWASTLDKNVSLRSVATEFINSGEFIGRYGPSLSNAAFVDALYQNVLHRGGDTGGIAYWNQQLDTKARDRPDVLVQFTQLPEFVGISAANISNGYWVV